MQPFGSPLAGKLLCNHDQPAADPTASEVNPDNRIKQERVDSPVPGHTDESHQAAVQLGADVAEAPVQDRCEVGLGSGSGLGEQPPEFFAGNRRAASVLDAVHYRE